MPKSLITLMCSAQLSFVRETQLPGIEYQPRFCLVYLSFTVNQTLPTR
jgi:hypothetical protein